MIDRIQKLRVLLEKQGVDAALISKTANILYLTGYAGFSETEREAFLLVTKQKSYLITSMLHSTAVKKTVKNSIICETTPENSYGDWIAKLCGKHTVKTLGIEANNLTVSEYKKISAKTKKSSLDLSTLRLIKTTEEIENITKACAIGDKAFSSICRHIKPGMTEKEIARKLELSIYEQHAEISFRTIVAVNQNAAVPHHMTDETKVTKQALILFDFGVKYNNYCSDMSRTIILGKPTAKQILMYEAVKNAQQKAAEYIKEKLQKGEKIKTSEPDKVARDHIISQGFPPFPHSLGHGIGIEVHEPHRLSPYSEGYLENGIVFSIEPGIYIPDFGGVRIEDLFVIEKNQLVQITKSPYLQFNASLKRQHAKA